MVADSISALTASASGFFRALWRAARQVFHEVTGALFAVFAVDGAALSWRAWRHAAGPLLVALALAFTFMMGFFAATSFRSAGRVR